MTAAVSDVARVVLDTITPGTPGASGAHSAPGTPGAPARIQVSVPRYEYKLDLVFDGDAAALAALAGREGKRLSGVIRGKAQRMWAARAGGCFIEPIWGHPRIVQGRVLATDLERNAVLLDLVVPAWFDLDASQSAAEFQTGDMLNFYVESGVRFTPSAQSER